MPLDHKATLIGLLGLQNTATDEEIAVANSSFQADMVGYKEQMDDIAKKSKADVKEATDALTAANTEIGELKNRNKELLGELANRDIAEHKEIIADVEAVREALVSNRAGTLKFLNSIKAKAAQAPAPETAKEPLHNSKTAAQPAPVSGEGTANAETDSKWVSNRARELQSSVRGLGHRDAFNMARAELDKKNAAK